MTNVSITHDRLVVDMLGWDKLWSLKSRIEVPLANVREVRSAAGERARGLRMPGTYIPGLIAAGTFERDGRREFWAVHNAQQTVAIELQGEFFARLVVQVPDPMATVTAVQKALNPRRRLTTRSSGRLMAVGVSLHSTSVLAMNRR